MKNFAVVYTVKNEKNILKHAIEYYRSIGCKKFYIYWDGTTDESEKIFSSYYDVEARNSIKLTELNIWPDWINEISHMWEENMDVRKRINTYIASNKSLEDDIDWLLCIDPDEILFFKEGNFNEFIEKVPNNIDQILLRNLEVVPVAGNVDNPFASCTMFYQRFPVTEFIWRYSTSLVRRLFGSPVVQAWYDFLFYQIRFIGLLPRLMRHPITMDFIPCAYYFGYSNHKSMIKVKNANLYKFNIHKWEKFQKNPVSKYFGNILHYDLCSVDYFINKFNQRSESIIIKVFYVRYMLAKVARECKREDVVNFFDSNICFKNQNTIDKLIKGGIVININLIANFFKK